MHRMMLLLLIVALIAACGDDKLTDNRGIVVNVQPSRIVMDFGDTLRFSVYVEGTNDDAVIWYVGGVAGGDTIHGLIGGNGSYIAPTEAPPETDSVGIEARLAADPSKTGRAWAVLIDPSTIYVDLLGNDSTGVGSVHRPYRTITKALTRAYAGQQILVSAGEFNVPAGEQFPLEIPAAVSLKGAGPDSTFVTGPGGLDYNDALVQFQGDAILVEGLHIRSSNGLGVGIWLRPGIYNRVVDNRVSSCKIGIYVDGPGGPGIPRPLIDATRLDSDSIGIVTADTCAPLIRQSSIAQCYKYGIDIRDMSRPDLGINDSTGAGNNFIDSCGIGNQWLIYNGTPDTIMAVGNDWPFATPSFNDQFIYDDNESDASGPVILENQ